jgi:MFS family permease
MKPESTFERMEKTTWLRVFEDGIWDIAIGLVLLAFGLSVITGMTAVVTGGVVVGLVSVAGVKKGVTEPRIGRVRFRGRRGRRLGDVTWLLAALSIAGLLVFLFIAWTARGAAPAWAIAIRDHFLIVIALIWGGAAAFCGWLLELRRFYAYGALIAATLIASDLTSGYSLGVALIACGGLIALVGLGLLFRFVRRYPRLPTEGAVDE